MLKDFFQIASVLGQDQARIFLDWTKPSYKICSLSQVKLIAKPEIFGLSQNMANPPLICFTEDFLRYEKILGMVWNRSCI